PTRPGSTRSSRAPISAIAPWRAKLARVRRSKSASAGTNVADTPSASESRDLGKGEAVEVARVGGRVGAGVLDEDEIAVLQVRREQLLAHDDVDGIAGRPGDVPRHGLAVAVGVDVVAQSLRGLDDDSEHASVTLHPAQVVVG